MRVLVQAERCQGHGRCFIECPQVFGSDAEGFATVAIAEPGAELTSAVRRAADSCPERAISISTGADGRPISADDPGRSRKSA